MPGFRSLRFFLIALVLCLGVLCSLASVQTGQAESGTAYPNARFLCTGQWLMHNKDAKGLVVVDVRRDKHFDNALIPGAIRMPWSLFRTSKRAQGLGDVFVGADRAQEILGRHGITRRSKVVLYDSVARDGGATSSYVFWVLDLLGHEHKMILEQGIDGWKAAGGEVTREAMTLDTVLYQVPVRDMHLSRLVKGNFLRPRLGDRYCQIVDVRSPGEYRGELANTDLNGKPLKRGHMPRAVNIPDSSNWVQEKTKKIKSYASLQGVYQGLEPDKAVVTYCHSGRRGSFAYYILRLMGFADVRLYERSWNEWGREDRYFPVQTVPHVLSGSDRPQGEADAGKDQAQKGEKSASPEPVQPAEDSGGYVSCGG